MPHSDSDTEIDPQELRDAQMWWCGGCDSVIPIGYWHVCTEDIARSGPSNADVADTDPGPIHRQEPR